MDDDFPTYREVLENVDRSGKQVTLSDNKEWHRDPDRALDLVSTFRHRSQPLLVDIHDGSNVSAADEMTTATHFHQCDLLVLDYQLDKRSDDGAQAIEILRALMSNDHFNLVVIYTRGGLDAVYNAVRWRLISASDQCLPEQHSDEAKELIAMEEDEDESENFGSRIRGSIDSAQYFDFRHNPKKSLGKLIQGKPPYTLYSGLANQVGWRLEQQKLVLQYLLKETEHKYGIGSDSQCRFDLEWSSHNPKWIKSDSAFIALSQKTDNHDDLLSDLQKALVDWNPRPSRLFLTKLRAEIDDHGIAAQGQALQNHHALAYWYYHLLLDSEEDDRRWRIADSISRHSTQLLDRIHPRVEEFASRLVQEEVKSGKPADICESRFGIDLSNDKTRKDAALEHNAFVCSKDPVGWHLTTGHVFLMSDEYWICLSPACDMVPSQLRKWKLNKFGERLPFIGVNLTKVRPESALGNAQSNWFVFFRVDGKVLCYCLNDPSNEGSLPRWELLFAENRGRLSGEDFQFKVARIHMGKSTRLVSNSYQANVISQVRYEYALNFIQKLGVSLTRVGLDFSGGA